ICLYLQNIIMHSKWTNSERLRLLDSHKKNEDWASIAEKMNEEYPERPNNFFNEKNCKAELDRICNEACPKKITPDEPTQPFKKAAVIDAWIIHLQEQVRLDTDKMLEVALVELRKQADLIEKLMSREKRPPGPEMAAMLAKLREDNKKHDRDAAQKQRVEAIYRAKILSIIRGQGESSGNNAMTPPVTLSISPTKPSNVELQPAFRSPSPIKSPITSPIRPLAEVIEEADAAMVETVEDPKMEMETPVASPSSKVTSPNEKVDQDKCTLSPRTAADRAIGEGGLEEEMEEEEEEMVKEEEMEVDEKTEELSEVKEEEDKPMATRKSTRVSTTSVETTPVRTGREKRKKDPSPQSSEWTASKKEEESKEKEEMKEEEGRGRRTSTRGRPSTAPTSAVPTAAISTPTPVEEGSEKGRVEEKEEGGAKTRRSSRVEKQEEKNDDKKDTKKEVKKEEKKKEEKRDDEKEEDEGMTKRVTRRSAIEKEGEKPEEKDSKEEVTFVAPSVASRTRNHRGSDQIEEKEKEKSEEPISLKTRSSGRHSLSTKSGSEAKESPVPSEKKAKRGEKKDDETDEKETRGRKEISMGMSETSLVGIGGKRDVEVLTEVSVRHSIVPSHPISPSKTRKAAERESPSTPVARKSSRVSSISSTSGKAVTASVEVQTEKVEMKHDDEVFVYFNSNEQYFNPVCDVERGRGRPKKEIKTETEEEKEKEKPVSRRTRGGEMSEDEGGSRSGSVSQSEKGTPSRRKESKRDLMTLHLDVDDDTGRYWLLNGATHLEIVEVAPAPSVSKRSRALMTEISGRRSMNNMDPMRQAIFKACKDMELHRHSSVFKANVAQKDAPDYYDCVHQPVCLSKLKQEIIEGRITDPVSLMRQLAIMFMNGAMYNSTAHDYWMYAVEMFKESYKPIRDIMPAELQMVEDEEVPKLTRARRNNEPAFAKDAVLCDRDRSMTLDRYFKCESVDAEEMETSTDDHRALYTRNKVDSTRKRRI
ncbi:hypothetical protein PMAYCL1PPCAC_07374, partial [Pristionchus mayeri]